MNTHEMNNKMSNTVNKTSKWTQTEQRACKNNSCKTANKTQKNAPKTRKWKWHREESAKHQKLTNMTNLARKTMKQSVKLLQKAKEARMHMLHAKTQEVQQNNHTSIRVDTYNTDWKMPKYNNVKNYFTDLAIAGQLTTARTQRKTQHWPSIHTKRLRMHSRAIHKQKCISISWNALANLANGDCSIFDKSRVRNCHPIKFLKSKIRPIRFERCFTHKHVCVLTLCTGVKIQNFGESK